ncbi:tight adherance operon protein [Leminorella grimontii]|uniref:Tight adherance operon protein n=1 Tax=Leminorella grimontii TaxID=82981 RepID=A0AAV5N3J1_9GAMM|nr:type II secretion system F family protein [Leminorella grimontii]KFC94786.1 Flp pilus assembly protein [Leminorella grimontii ATCC 33999 = DSM 5078]GKX56530.1 tight adherance operon protein [Leminorella grimontii]GKX59870.1 tight adherance operon protein [Leminorella grimontii]VFS61558.1 Flp pilus assembly protein TadB [Leminorella grimontii]
MIVQWLIVLAGVLMLALNVLQWKKRRGMLEGVKGERPAQNALREKAGELCREWLQYFRGYHDDKTVRNLSLVFIIFGVVAAINAWWTRFDWFTVITLTVLATIWGFLRMGRIENRRLFDNAFPEVLSVVNAAVSSGSSIHHAIERAGQDVSGPLGAEFHRIGRRLNLGEDAEVVFNDAYQRFKYKEFYFFIIVMLVSVQRGGQLRVLMSRLARVVANSKAMERKKLAMTSEARMSAKIVAAIPVLFFFGMKFFSPENFDFVVGDPAGRIILYYVLASEALGLGIIWLLVRRVT